MLLRKRALEDKLRRKRESREKAMSASTGAPVNMDYDSDDDKLQSEAGRLEEAFSNVVSLIKDTKGIQLDTVGMSELMAVMDRIAKGETVTALPVLSAKEAFELREADARAQMQLEVKRISSAFSEEQQKLDLMLKMQQARQRQNLQRKLMERKRGSML